MEHGCFQYSSTLSTVAKWRSLGVIWGKTREFKGLYWKILFSAFSFIQLFKSRRRKKNRKTGLFNFKQCHSHTSVHNDFMEAKSIPTEDYQKTTECDHSEADSRHQSLVDNWLHCSRPLNLGTSSRQSPPVWDAKTGCCGQYLLQILREGFI